MTNPGARSRLPRLVTLSVLVGVLALLVSATWAPFVTRPSIYLVASAVGMALVVLAGTILRSLRSGAPVVLLGQLVAAFGWLQWRFDHLGPLWRSVRTGATAANTYEAPVPAEHLSTAPFLATCAVALAIGIDLLAVGLLRTAVVGLPLLLALTIPISTLDARVPLSLLLAVMAVFAVLLALEHRWSADDWGEVIGSAQRRPFIVLVASLGVGAGLLGLVAATIVPLGDGIDFNRGDGEGRGATSVTNPMVEIRRGLVNQSHLPMLTATTHRRTPHYLRLAVLDRFDGERWTPSARDLPSANRVDRGIPAAPGLYSSVPGNTETYQLAYSEVFSSQWLATPYPYLSVDITGGDYRYDERTLDLFNIERNEQESALAGYTVEAFIPSFDANDLDGAGSAPSDIEEEMTVLPDDMPAEIAAIAADVIGEERSDYQRVVALQDWFRNTGGFRYSLWDGPSTTGTEALLGFLTTDKVGYCEQFATAMAAMTRTIGIPSRVAVGFGRPRSSPAAGDYVFTGESLHAWTEVYFEGYGWVVFDPTPAVQSGPAPAYSEGIEEAAQPRSGETEAPSAQPSPTRPDRDLDPGAADEADQGTPAWPWFVVGVLLLLAVTPRTLRTRQRSRRLGVLQDGATSPADLADAAWRELRATARDLRLEWPESKSPRTTLIGLQRQLDLDRAQVARVAALGGLVERARYARSAEFSAGEQEALRTDVSMLLDEMKAAGTPADRRRARWWPRSLWDRADRE